MFIYKIIEANCPFRLEQCLSTFYFFSNDFDALQANNLTLLSPYATDLTSDR
jgi:hypothetical protein